MPAVPTVDLHTVEVRFGSRILKTTIAVKRLERLNRAFVGIIWETPGTVPVSLAREYADLLAITAQRASDIILALREDGYQVVDTEQEISAEP